MQILIRDAGTLVKSTVLNETLFCGMMYTAQTKMKYDKL